MYDRILVPLDGGPRGELALLAGVRLADLWSAHLEVLGLADTDAGLTATEEAVHRQTVDLGGRARVTVRIASHAVGDEVALAIESTRSTLVVMATSARSRSAAVTESIADTVLHRIHGPALLIGPNATIEPDWPSGRMFICADGSALSEEILSHAATIADALELAPWLIAVGDPLPLPEGSEAMETNYTARLATRLEPMVTRQVNFDTLHGPQPADEIVAYARVHDGALIAMATHGRTGIQRLALGSVAMQVVHEAHCPVLVARPWSPES